eukprot:4389871-Heterocapsa_arctica.AAC.1
MHWSEVMYFDIDGDEYINFLGEAADRKQWGGARQVAIFAHMEKCQRWYSQLWQYGADLRLTMETSKTK